VGRVRDAIAARPRLVVAAAMLLSSLAVYAPYWNDIDKVCRYWDGPPYMYVAKSLYLVPADHPFTPYDLPPLYFANHLPLYPLLIRLLSVVTLGHFPTAMLLATLVSATGAALLFFELLRRFELVASPVWTAMLFCVLPPRWVIYHAVGATEPLFLCCIFAALLALASERPVWVAVFTGLAALTRVTGVLLVPAFMLYYLERREWRRAALLPLSMVGLLALFAYYHLVFGDFFAYFTWNRTAQVVSLHPLEIFRRYTSPEEFRGAAKFHSAELVAATYIAYAVGTLALWRKRALFWYSLVTLVFCLFIAHPDLPRYMVPLAPFALLVAFDPILNRGAVRAVLPLVLYLDYTYAWSYLPQKLVSASVYQAVVDSPSQPFAGRR
jgi:hypothetical protein